MIFLHERWGYLNAFGGWETSLFKWSFCMGDKAKHFLCLRGNVVWMVFLHEGHGCLNAFCAWETRLFKSFSCLMAVWISFLPETRLFEWSFCRRQGCLNDFYAWMTGWLNGKTSELCLFGWHAVWLASCLNSCLNRPPWRNLYGGNECVFTWLTDSKNPLSDSELSE